MTTCTIKCRHLHVYGERNPDGSVTETCAHCGDSWVRRTFEATGTESLAELVKRAEGKNP